MADLATAGRYVEASGEVRNWSRAMQQFLTQICEGSGLPPGLVERVKGLIVEQEGAFRRGAAALYAERCSEAALAAEIEHLATPLAREFRDGVEGMRPQVEALGREIGRTLEDQIAGEAAKLGLCPP